MDDASTEARCCLQRFVSAWLAGDHSAVAEVCHPAVRWWTPLAPEQLNGAGELSAHLDALLQDVALPVEITALVVNHEGTRGVIEMLAAPAAGTQSTALTSVVELAGDNVVAGRTYTDVHAHPSLSRRRS